PGPLGHARAVGDQQRRERPPGAASARRREPLAGEHLARRDQRVELVRLPPPAVLALRALDLDDTEPLGQQVLAQPDAVAAGALDPDHDIVAEPAKPVAEAAITVQARRDRE